MPLSFEGALYYDSIAYMYCYLSSLNKQQLDLRSLMCFKGHILTSVFPQALLFPAHSDSLSGRKVQRLIIVTLGTLDAFLISYHFFCICQLNFQCKEKLFLLAVCIVMCLLEESHVVWQHNQYLLCLPIIYFGCSNCLRFGQCEFLQGGFYVFWLDIANIGLFSEQDILNSPCTFWELPSS